jgi:hypothetical protein
MTRLGYLYGSYGLPQLEPGSWTDVIAIATALVVALLTTGAWLFSRRTRARSALYRLGVDVSDRSLVSRIEAGDNNAVELLLRAGIRPEVPIDGRTPIEAALEAGNVDSLKALLKRSDAGIAAGVLVKAAQSSTQPAANDVYSVPTLPTGEILAGVQEVMDHLRGLILTDLDSAEHTEMLNLGLDLEVVQTFLTYRVILQKDYRNLDYKGMLLDTEADLIRPVINGGSSIHATTARAVVAKFSHQIAENEQLLDHRDISIEIRSYGLPPTIHGFLVDDSHLYLGFTEFHGGKLQGGQFAYLYLSRSKSDEMTAHLFRVFRSWFMYHWSRGAVLCKS